MTGAFRWGPVSRSLIASSGRVVLVWLAVAVIASTHRPLDAAGFAGVSLAAAVWLMALRAAAARAPYVIGHWVPAAIGATAGLVGVAAINPYLDGLQLPVAALLGAWAGVLLTTAVWEEALERTARRRVLVVGSSVIGDIEAAAAREGTLPFEILAVDPDREAPEEGTGSLVATDLAPVVAAQQPDLIVLADEATISRSVERLLDITDRRFRVAGLTSFYEHVFGCVPLGELTPTWFMSLLHVRQRAPRRPSKRCFDIVVAGLGLTLTAVLLPLLALAIKCTPGPVFYRQTRVGEGGRRFTIYKLRTMPLAAEHGGAVFAQPDDPRCTAIGKLLRRTHLDELPQLWNVLRGDMSIIGPRPERPEHIAMLEASVPYWSRRLLLKPGITGWAQVRCGYASDCDSAAEKLSHDFWYIRHGSLAVDLAVCLQTVRLVLGVLVPRALHVHGRPLREHALR